MIRRKDLTAFELFAVPAIRALVVAAHFNRFTLMSEYLSHRGVVPTRVVYTVELWLARS